MKFRRTIAPFLLSLSMSFCSPSPSGTISELVNPAEQTSPVRAESRKDFDNFDYYKNSAFENPDVNFKELKWLQKKLLFKTTSPC